MDRLSLSVMFLSLLALALAAPAHTETVRVNVATDTLHPDGCATLGFGDCSLRDAILFANGHPGADRIEFDPALDTVSVASELPSILDTVEIDGDRGTGQRLAIVNSDPHSAEGLTLAADGSFLDGLEITGFSSFAIRITGDGNRIGGDLGNRLASLSGIEIDGGVGNEVKNTHIEAVMNGLSLHEGASNNVVGGSPLSSLVMTSPGVPVLVGASPSDAGTSGNTLVFGRVWSMHGMMFDLGADSVTPNDAQDTDAGPNGFQNFPVLTSAVAESGLLVIGGSLHSTPGAAFTLHFYAGHFGPDGADVDLVGSQRVITDGQGNVAFVAPVLADVSPGQIVFATATSEDGSTSEEGGALVTNEPAGANFYSVTPCRIADTRNDQPLAANQTRDFQIAGLCGLPEAVRAVSLNLTVVAPTAGGHLSLFPAGAAETTTSIVNFTAGRTRANNATLSLLSEKPGILRAVYAGPAGATAHFLIDVNGYYL